MKLYHFNQNGYGEEYYTMAENKVEAYNALIAYLKKHVEDPEEYYKWNYEECLKKWENVNPEDPTTFPRKFSLDEFEAGHIIESEVA
jgi:hypothetical protein